MAATDTATDIAIAVTIARTVLLWRMVRRVELAQAEVECTKASAASAAAAELAGLRKWWRDEPSVAAASDAAVSDAPGQSQHPLTHDAARREHVAALRSLLAGQHEREAALTSIFTAELSAAEEVCRATNARTALGHAGAARFLPAWRAWSCAGART